MQGVIEVTASTFDQVVLQSELPVVVDFYAPWCGPCRQLGPILERLAGETNGTALIVKVNVDENMAIAAKYNVSGLPTLLFFKDGSQVDRKDGLMSLGDLRKTIASMSAS